MAGERNGAKELVLAVSDLLEDDTGRVVVNAAHAGLGAQAAAAAADHNRVLGPRPPDHPPDARRSRLLPAPVTTSPRSCRTEDTTRAVRRRRQAHGPPA